MRRIVTFYSYKGGVGRTFALANIAVLLASRGKKVLVMDWDLEAPGLHRYFQPYLPPDFSSRLGLIHLLKQANESDKADWRQFVINLQIKDAGTVSLIPSGDELPDYADCVRRFSWQQFFEERHGGNILERWRKEWKQNYDFVLVDSRTGITDAGGVCTILLPDILVLVFAANAQSFERGKQVVRGIQHSRRELAVRRPPVSVLPLVGRFDGRDEIDEASRWLDRFATELIPFYDDWLPSRFEPRRMLELTKIPYVTKFSFGEPLPVISQGVRDPDGPGFYLENVTRLIASDFREASRILAPDEPEPLDDIQRSLVVKGLEEAKSLAENGRFDEARRVVQGFPEQPELTLLKENFLSQINEAENQHRVVDDFKSAIERAKSLVNEEKFEEARQIIHRLPDAPRELALMKQNFSEQIDGAERQSKDVEQIQRNLVLTKTLAEKGEFAEARRILKSLPDNPREIVLVKENSLSQIDQAERAMNELGGPESAKLRNEAVTAFNAHRLDEALLTLRKALNITPTATKLKEELSMVLTAVAVQKANSILAFGGIHELTQVEAMLREAVVLDPKNENAQKGLDQIATILRPRSILPTVRQKWWKFW